MNFSMLNVASVAVLFAVVVMGCEPGDFPTPELPNSNAGQTAGGSDPATEPEASPQAPAPDPCDVTASVDLGVMIHTLLVNGSPNGFFVEGNFDWQATGPQTISVAIEFKPAGGAWITVADALPRADVLTVDLSQYAGPSSAWHFRGIVRTPGCDIPVAYSDITTIQN